MAANALNCRTAVSARIQVVRAFVRLLELLATHKDLARKLDELERKYDAASEIDVLRAAKSAAVEPGIGPQGVEMADSALVSVKGQAVRKP